ncbi:MAG: transcriptional repressor LexA [Gammaproteobacteria bacterium]
MLTALEEKILQFITRHIAQQGHAPTIAEIGKGVGLRSRGTVHRYVESLIDKGHLQRSERSWRSLRLTGENSKRLHTLPLAGRIAAGAPIEAIAGEDEINIGELFDGPDRFVLKVKGDSMIEAGILDGDYVVVRYSTSARDGDIVVALIDEQEATLKRFRRNGSQIELLPENSELTPLVYPADRVQIQGILVGQMRGYQ